VIGSYEELAGLIGESEAEALSHVTYAKLHPHVVRMVESGDFTILDLFDTLPWFKSGADWRAWRAFLAALYGLPMSDHELEVYKRCTGRAEPPKGASREAWVIVGRRGRKSAIAALIGVWSAAFKDYSGFLAPGERGVVPILAKTKAEAKQIHSYAKAILSTGALSALLQGVPTAETIELTTGVDLEIRAATITAGRSRTVVAALLDELAFWRSDESATPDREILRGIRPAMTTIPNALLLGLSSPYAPRGVLWESFQDHFGKNSNVLVWKADTLTMHDSPQIRAEVDRAYDEDPVAAAAEYGGEFRADVQAFVTPEAVDAATAHGRMELPPVSGERYFAFCDPSGGSKDSFTLAIAHSDRGLRVVVDLIREWPAPFSPSVVVRELGQELKRFGLRMVTGDHYAGEWPADLFRTELIAFDVSDAAKSEIYLDFLPLLNSRLVELLDNRKLKTQLLALDRRTSRVGRDSVDHPPGGHDDVINAVAGAVRLASVVLIGQREMAHREALRTGPPAKDMIEQHTREVHASLRAKVNKLMSGRNGHRRRGGIGL
jgi:hypothetical protein